MEYLDTFRIDFGDMAGRSWRMLDSCFDSTAEAASGLRVEFIISSVGYVNLKYKVYHPKDAMTAAGSLIAPYNKPILLQHGGGGFFSPPSVSDLDPVGRVTGGRYEILTPGDQTEEPNETNTPKGRVIAELSILDPDAATKVLDGRYSTMSVLALPALIYCNICGLVKGGRAAETALKKQADKDVECEHVKGAIYDGVQAHDLYRKYTYEEVSFVTFPADVYAQKLAAKGDAISTAYAKVISGVELFDSRRVIVPIKPASYYHQFEDQALGSEPMKDTNEELTQVKADLDSANSKVASLESESATLKSKVDALESQVAKMKLDMVETYTVLRGLNGSLGKDKDTIVSSMDKLREQVKSFSTDQVAAMSIIELDLVRDKILALATEDEADGEDEEEDKAEDTSPADTVTSPTVELPAPAIGDPAGDTRIGDDQSADESKVADTYPMSRIWEKKK